MDGYIANLAKIVELETYNALTMIDDCHATGFVGERVEERRSIVVFSAKLILSPARSAKPWVVHLGIYPRSEGNCCPATATITSLFILQYTRTGDRGNIDYGVRFAENDDSLRLKLRENSEYFAKR